MGWRREVRLGFWGWKCGEKKGLNPSFLFGCYLDFLEIILLDFFIY